MAMRALVRVLKAPYVAAVAWVVCAEARRSPVEAAGVLTGPG